MSKVCFIKHVILYCVSLLTLRDTYLEVNIGEEKFMIAPVNNGGMIRASKHMSGIPRHELSQHNWFSAQNNLLAIA